MEPRRLIPLHFTKMLRFRMDTREQADAANKIIAQAQRNTKMALLLKQGGFEAEVDAPLEKARLLLREAYDKTIAIAKEMNDTE